MLDNNLHRIKPLILGNQFIQIRVFRSPSPCYFRMSAHVCFAFTVKSSGEDLPFLELFLSDRPVLCKLTPSCRHRVLYTNITTCIFYFCFSKEFLHNDLANLALYIVKSSNAVALKDYSVYI